ncbi:MAG TPA: hypothetical protein VFM05_08385 [Candidatus Saccharimonadales bacterium]|nr:hypothetical protein [Candidatus Saccharimonadales bacterium]
MKHTTLARIAPLLQELRRHHSLREVRPTVFYVNDRDFLHFHDERDGVFADVRLARAFVRLPVSTRAEQLELLGQIDECLSSLDSHMVRRRRRGRDLARGRRQ